MSDLSPASIEKMTANFLAKGGQVAKLDMAATSHDQSTVPQEYQVFNRGVHTMQFIWEDAKRARIRALIAAEASRDEVIAAMEVDVFLKDWHQIVHQLRMNGIQLPKYLELDMSPAPRAPNAKKKRWPSHEGRGGRCRVLSDQEVEAFDMIRRGTTIGKALALVGLDRNTQTVQNISSLVNNRFGDLTGLQVVGSRQEMVAALAEKSAPKRVRVDRVCIRCKGARDTMDGRAEAKRMCAPCENLVRWL